MKTLSEYVLVFVIGCIGTGILVFAMIGGSYVFGMYRPTPTPTPTPGLIYKSPWLAPGILPKTVVDVNDVTCTIFDTGCMQCVPAHYTPVPDKINQLVGGPGTILDQERGTMCWDVDDAIRPGDHCWTCIPLPGSTNLPTAQGVVAP